MTLLTTPQAVSVYNTLTKAHVLGFRIVIMAGTILESEIKDSLTAEALSYNLRLEDDFDVEFSMTSNDTSVSRLVPVSDLWDNSEDLFAGFVRITNFFLSN